MEEKVEALHFLFWLHSEHTSLRHLTFSSVALLPPAATQVVGARRPWLGAAQVRAARPRHSTARPRWSTTATTARDLRHTIRRARRLPLTTAASAAAHRANTAVQIPHAADDAPERNTTAATDNRALAADEA